MINFLSKKASSYLVMSSVIALSIFCKAETVLLEKDSMYNSIRVVEDGRFLSLYCGNGHQSMMDTQKPDRLVFNYTKTMMTSLAYNKQVPSDVLLIGGGGASIPKFIQKYFPQTKIDVVEIDPEIDRISQKYFKFTPSKTTNVFTEDGRVYVKKAKKKYDVVMLDAFRGGYIPVHLLTKEFLTEVKSKLKPNGIIVSNTFTGSKIKKMENGTYLSVFKNLYEMETGGNRIIIADNRNIKKNEFAQRAAAIDNKYAFDGMKLQNIINNQFKAVSKSDVDEPMTDDHSAAELLGD